MVSKLAWEIGWTFTKALKNLKICALMGSFCWKRNVSARKFQRNYVSWHWKVTQNLSENRLVTWKMTRNSVNFYASSWKFENLHLMGSFCRKDTFYIKKYRRVVSHDTGEWCKVWRKTGSWFQKLHDKFGKFSWEQKSENLHFDVLLLSIAYKVSAKKVQKSYLSWHWRVIQTLNKNSFFIWKMTWEIWWILTRAVENLKICTSMEYFCQKYVMFELK